MEWRVLITGFILCIRYSIPFWAYHQKTWEAVTDNPSIGIFANKTELGLK